MPEETASPVPAVEIRGLTKRYRLTWRRKILVAVDHLDLTVQQGEVYGLLGPNGSGKSTTLKILLGLLPANEGFVKMFGMAPDSIEAKRKVGYLPENPYFYRFLTGDELLKFFGRLSGLGGQKLDQRIDDLIQLVNLENGRDRPLSAYSKGMLQRIGLAQALLHDPELLLLDEPTAGVDPVGSREIRDLILRLKHLGKTVIFCSHLLEQVQEVSDRVAIMRLGRKLVEGTIDELLTLQDRTQIIVTGLPHESEAEAADLLAKLGGKRVEISRPKLSLEELFLRTVEMGSEAIESPAPPIAAKKCETP
jgi:ABC-2 type transport system ATP-binding protein